MHISLPLHAGCPENKPIFWPDPMQCKYVPFWVFSVSYSQSYHHLQFCYFPHLVVQVMGTMSTPSFLVSHAVTIHRHIQPSIAKSTEPLRRLASGCGAHQPIARIKRRKADCNAPCQASAHCQDTSPLNCSSPSPSRKTPERAFPSVVVGGS